ESLRAERFSSLGVCGGVAERSARESGEEPDAQSALFVTKRCKSRLEQRHQMLVVPRGLPAKPAAVAERGAPELVRQTQRLGESRGLSVRLFGSGGVAGAAVRVAECKQELAANRVVRRFHAVENPKRNEEEAG